MAPVSLQAALAGGRRFFSPYYTASVTILGSYFLARAWWLVHADPSYARMPPGALAEKVCGRLRRAGRLLAVADPALLPLRSCLAQQPS